MCPNQIIGQQQKKPADQFHDLFMDAIKHKSMGNYDKAIEKLQECEGLNPQEYAVYYELGRNYYFQKKYIEASEAFDKALSLDHSNSWIKRSLYNVYLAEGNHIEAIKIATELSEKFPKYKEELVALFINSQQIEKAIALINELDKEQGYSLKREQYKEQIGLIKGTINSDIKSLNQDISDKPKEVSNYLSLIHSYLKKGDQTKANKSAQELLFQVSNAAQRIEESLDILESDNDKQEILCLIAASYVTTQDYQTAIKLLKSSITINQYHLDSHLLLLQVLNNTENYQEMDAIASELIVVFPLQPELYYFLGLTKNEQQDYKKAKTILEDGLDFVVENDELEIRIRQQLKRSCQALELVKEVSQHNSRIQELLKTK